MGVCSRVNAGGELKQQGDTLFQGCKVRGEVGWCLGGKVGSREISGRWGR